MTTDIHNRECSLREQAYLHILAGVIRTFRKGAGLTQSELALRCGVDRSYISDIEKGSRNPSLQILLRLAEGISCPLSVLIIRTELLFMEGTAYETNCAYYCL